MNEDGLKNRKCRHYRRQLFKMHIIGVYRTSLWPNFLISAGVKAVKEEAGVRREGGKRPKVKQHTRLTSTREDGGVGKVTCGGERETKERMVLCCLSMHTIV